jgi:hypothetical protein
VDGPGVGDELEGQVPDPHLVARDRPGLAQGLVDPETGQPPGGEIGCLGKGQVGKCNRPLGGEALHPPPPVLAPNREGWAKGAMENEALTRRRNTFRLLDEIGDVVEGLPHPCPGHGRYHPTL